MIPCDELLQFAPHMSQRQRDVLRLMMQGKREKEIADDLGLSVNTIKSHKARVHSTFGALTTQQIFFYLFKEFMASQENKKCAVS